MSHPADGDDPRPARVGGLTRLKKWCKPRNKRMPRPANKMVDPPLNKSDG